jgi:hypothetical protein
VSKKAKDLVLVHGRTEDGAGVNVIRARQERLEFGTLRPLEHGKPIHSGEVVKLRPTAECPLIFEAETQFRADDPTASVPSGEDAAPQKSTPPAAPRLTAGPAKVASPNYRRNWDAIWKRPSRRRSELN